MSSDWKPSVDDPRVHTRFTGGGYEVRWELPIPATRVRCDRCRKDIVPKKDGTPHNHDCDTTMYVESKTLRRELRGYGYVKRLGILRVLGTLGQAVAVAQYKAGFAPRPEQLEMAQ